MAEFIAIIEKDLETGYFVATVPSLPGAHTQAESIDELISNLQEVVQLCFEELDEDSKDSLPKFFCIQKIPVKI